MKIATLTPMMVYNRTNNVPNNYATSKNEIEKSQQAVPLTSINFKGMKSVSELKNCSQYLSQLNASVFARYVGGHQKLKIVSRFRPEEINMIMSSLKDFKTTLPKFDLLKTLLKNDENKLNHFNMSVNGICQYFDVMSDKEPAVQQTVAEVMGSYKESYPSSEDLLLPIKIGEVSEYDIANIIDGKLVSYRISAPRYGTKDKLYEKGNVPAFLTYILRETAQGSSVLFNFKRS